MPGFLTFSTSGVLLLSSAVALGFSTHGGVTTRHFDRLSAPTNEQLVVTCTFTNGEPSPVRGFYFADQIPASLTVTTLHVRINGAERENFIYEWGNQGDVYSNCAPRRWVLERPTHFPESNAIPPSGEVQIVYAISSSSTGVFHLREFSWAGYYPGAGAAFGYSETNDWQAVTFFDSSDVTSSHSSTGYRSPGTNTIACQVSYPAGRQLLSLLWRPSLPSGWVLNGVSGQGAPEIHTNDILFTGDLGPNPLSFAYTIAVPDTRSGPAPVSATVEYMLNGMLNVGITQAAPHPLVVTSLHTLAVSSIRGAPLPSGVTTHAWNTVIAASVPDSPVPSGSTTQYVCTGWMPSGSVPPNNGTTNTGPFAITNDSTIAWNWKTQFRFEATAAPGGNVLATDGWYDQGRSATATAEAVTGFVFRQWAGAVSPSLRTNNPVVLAMSQSRSIRAEFDADTNQISASHIGDSFHSPGTDAVVLCSFRYPASQRIASLTWTPLLPKGWKPRSAEGYGNPAVIGTNIVFSGTLTNNPFSFRCALTVAGNAAITSAVNAVAQFRFQTMSLPYSLAAEPTPLWLRRYHSADYRSPFWSIDGTEVNRVLAYWRAGGYYPEPRGNDGYAATNAPNLGDTSNGLHSADFATNHWVIDMTEANRALAYWRAGGYRPDPAGDDGYGEAAAGGGSGSEPPKAGALAEPGQGSPATYDPGQTVRVTNTFTYEGNLLSLGWRPRVPNGWTVLSVEGEGGAELRRGEILWAGRFPGSPIRMTYDVQVPLWALGTQQVQSEVEYCFMGMVNATNRPASPVTLTLVPRDSDRDGLPDGWEKRYAGNPTNMLPDADDDRDGASNLRECWAGTDPSSSQSVLRVNSMVVASNDTLRIVWPSATGRSYRVQSSTGNTGRFEPQSPAIPSVPPTNTHAIAPLGGGAFYRIRVTP